MRARVALGLALVSLMPSLCFAGTEINVQVSAYWEGRELRDPNIEALAHFRKAFPAIPLTHFINPTYFLDESKTVERLQSLQSVMQSDDEVGLYLAPMEPLVREAGVILKLQPSFWGYMDEGEICEDDCGLDVPLTVYNREEVLRIFAVAHQTMLKAGFTGLRSFAVRGWMEAPFLIPLAAAFGYQVDASPIDPELVSRKLKEFPIAAWLTQRWGTVLDENAEFNAQLIPSGSKIRFIPQLGGILELNEQKDILARFDRLVKDRIEHPNHREIFTLSLSAETAFQSWPKLKMILQSLDERAKKDNLTLTFATASAAKNGRPIAISERISSKLAAKAVVRK